jgi:hypothetical protein
MGEAKRRGTFEERKAKSIALNGEIGKLDSEAWAKRQDQLKDRADNARRLGGMTLIGGRPAWLYRKG